MESMTRVTAMAMTLISLSSQVHIPSLVVMLSHSMPKERAMLKSLDSKVVVANAVSLITLSQPDNPLPILLHITLVITLKKTILMLAMKMVPSHGNK